MSEAGRGGPAPARPSAAELLPLGAVVAAAFAVRLVPLLAGGGLFGATNYDPAVYYAAAVGWFEGQLPYRDFLLL